MYNKYVTSVLFFIFLTLLSGCSTSKKNDNMYSAGVSLELASMRRANYNDVSYSLYFDIPSVKTEKIKATQSIKLFVNGTNPIVLDFLADSAQIQRVRLNDSEVPYVFENEHIVISSDVLENDTNRVEVSFTAGDMSLNRRDDFMYTLLVPDRARTLFPCFDQPDIKARFNLRLSVPSAWKAVANGKVVKQEIMPEQGKTEITFSETKPLSTYLFSFVVGNMYGETFTKDGRTITIYHRETDPFKVSQCSDIADEVFYDLKWQEEYTGIPYPFDKYDLIIVPGFQFGGMEHVGATLFNDRRMFIERNATLDERLARSVLIAHETTHMWFGDLVTMKWFDDVWTKEVFANFYGSMIAQPHFPGVNHQLNFMLDYFPAAYSEDRTMGTNSIKQNLDNLNNAGLMYGHIIYKKSPVVMNMLYRMMGSEPFRNGMREYLNTYSYSNATWDDLITIMDKYTSRDLKEWSRVWCHEKGMPEINSRIEHNSLIIEQHDPLKRGLCWPQTLRYAVVNGKSTQTITIEMPSDKPVVITDLDGKDYKNAYVIPNVDGNGYGFFRISPDETKKLFDVLTTTHDEILRGSLLMTMYENLINKIIAPDDYIDGMLRYLPVEKNELLYTYAIAYVRNAINFFPSDKIKDYEQTVWNFMLTAENSQRALQAFRTYVSIAKSDNAAKTLYKVWSSATSPANFSLGEGDFINLSYKLAVMLPGQSDAITSVQEKRITNPDRLNAYKFVKPSVSSRREVRDSVFKSLLKVENRTVEPWASTALQNLNSSLRQGEAVEYIIPALDKVEEIQKTGGIFFPGSWINALLSGHNSPEAYKAVRKFFNENPDYPELLKNKILQRADHLYRFYR